MEKKLLNEVHTRILLFENKKKLLSNLPEHADEIAQLSNKGIKWLSSRFLQPTSREAFHPIEDCFGVLKQYATKESKVKAKYRGNDEYKEAIDKALPNKKWDTPNDILELTIDEMITLMTLLEFKKPLLDIDNTQIKREEVVGRVDAWSIYMPISRESSCVIAGYDEKTYMPKTTWCTARMHGSNLFYNYVARDNLDIVLFYLIKDSASEAEDYLSVGYREGKPVFGEGNGGLSVDRDNVGLTADRINNILGEDLWKRISRKLEDKIDSMRDKDGRVAHPVKLHVENARRDPVKLKNFYSNQSGTESIDSLKLLFSVDSFTNNFLYNNRGVYNQISSGKYFAAAQKFLKEARENERLEGVFTAPSDFFYVDTKTGMIKNKKGHFCILDANTFSDLLSNENIMKTSFFHGNSANQNKETNYNLDFFYYYDVYVKMLLAVCRLEELEKCKTIAINRSRKIVENIYLDGFDIKKSSFSRNTILKQSVGQHFSNDANYGEREILPHNAEQTIHGEKFKYSSYNVEKILQKNCELLSKVFGVDSGADASHQKSLFKIFLSYLYTYTAIFKKMHDLNKKLYTITDFANDMFLPPGYGKFERIQDKEGKYFEQNKKIVDALYNDKMKNLIKLKHSPTGRQSITSVGDWPTTGNYIINKNLGLPIQTTWEEAKKASKNRIYFLESEPKAYSKDLGLSVTLSSILSFSGDEINGEKYFRPAEILSYSNKFIKKYQHFLEEVFRNDKIDVIVVNKYGDHHDNTLPITKKQDSTYSKDLEYDANITPVFENAIKNTFEFSDSIGHSNKMITGQDIKSFFKNENVSLFDLMQKYPKLDILRNRNNDLNVKQSSADFIRLHHEIENTEENSDFFENREENKEILQNFLNNNAKNEDITNWNIVYWGEFLEFASRRHFGRFATEENMRNFKKGIKKTLNNSAYRILYFDNILNQLEHERGQGSTFHYGQSHRFDIGSRDSIRNNYADIIGHDGVQEFINTHHNIKFYGGESLDNSLKEKLLNAVLDFSSDSGRTTLYTVNTLKDKMRSSITGDITKVNIEQSNDQMMNSVIQLVFGIHYHNILETNVDLIKYYEHVKSILGVNEVKKLVNNGSNAEYNFVSDYMLEGVVGLRFIGVINAFNDRSSLNKNRTKILEQITLFLSHVKTKDTTLYDILCHAMTFRKDDFQYFKTSLPDPSEYDLVNIIASCLDTHTKKDIRAVFLDHVRHANKLGTKYAMGGKVRKFRFSNIGLHGVSYGSRGIAGMTNTTSNMGNTGHLGSFSEWLKGREKFEDSEPLHLITDVREKHVRASTYFVDTVDFCDYMSEMRSIQISYSDLFDADEKMSLYYWVYFKFVGPYAHNAMIKKDFKKYGEYVQYIHNDYQGLSKSELRNYSYAVGGYCHILSRFVDLAKKAKHAKFDKYSIKNNIEQICNTIFTNADENAIFKRHLDSLNKFPIQNAATWVNLKRPGRYEGIQNHRTVQDYYKQLFKLTDQQLGGLNTTGEEVAEVESYNFMDLPYIMFSDFFMIVYAFAYKNPQYRSLFNDPITFDVNHENTLNDMKEIVSSNYAEKLLKVVK